MNTFKHEWRLIGHWANGAERYVCETCGAAAFRAVHRFDQPIGKGYGPIHTNQRDCKEHFVRELLGRYEQN
jgi:hypothetical protein